MNGKKILNAVGDFVFPGGTKLVKGLKINLVVVVDTSSKFHRFITSLGCYRKKLPTSKLILDLR